MFADEKPQAVWKNPTAHDGWIHGLAVSPDGRLVATCGQDGLVRLWSAADGKLHKELSGHDAAVFRVQFHPGGESLVSGDLKGRTQGFCAVYFPAFCKTDIVFIIFMESVPELPAHHKVI